MHTHVSLSTSSITLAMALSLMAPAAAAAQAAQPPSVLTTPVLRPQPTGPAMELSMDRAVELGLESNLGLKSDRLNPESATHAVGAARSAFLPLVGSSVARSSSRSVPNDFTQGTADITSQGVNVNAFVNQTLPYAGTRYNFLWNNSRNTQSGGNPLFNPYLSSSFSLTVTQPLWRGLTVDQNRAALENSQRQRSIADIQLEQQVVRLEANVRNAYLDLISAIQGLRVAEQNMQIRQSTLADAKARVAVGAAAPIDLLSAEADVAANQEQILLAQAQIGTREDFLRTLVFDPSRPDYWQLHIVPTDTVQPTPRQIDVDAAIKNALQSRLDLIVARRQLEIEDLDLKAGKDARHPAVDLNVNYSGFGNGGTRFTYGNDFPPPIVARSDRGLGSVLGDTFGAAYPRWSVGVSVAYPIGQSAAEANYARQEVARRQSDLSVQQLEIAIVAQVREAARQVESTYQRVLVTQTALRASEQQLDAEQRRFAAGLSTTLELQVRQQQLSTARTAELNAAIAHNHALIEFDRVQKTQ